MTDTAMEHKAMTDWETEARAFSRRRTAAWIGSPSLVVLGLGSVAAGSGPAMTIIGWAAVAIGVALLVAGLVWGSAIYMRVVDEQERDANLWGAYAGATVYLALYGIRALLVGLGVRPPFGHDAIFVVFLITVMGVFLWKRYR